MCLTRTQSFPQFSQVMSQMRRSLSALGTIKAPYRTASGRPSFASCCQPSASSRSAASSSASFDFRDSGFGEGFCQRVARSTGSSTPTSSRTPPCQGETALQLQKLLLPPSKMAGCRLKHAVKDPPIYGKRHMKDPHLAFPESGS